MNIILIPGRGRNANITLTDRQVRLLGLALLLVSVSMGVLAYRVSALWRLPSPVRAALWHEQTVLRHERRRVMQARANATDHLDALSERVGLLQAQMMRLDALGTRLAKMAHIPSTTFDLAEEPPLGGPEKPLASHQNVVDFISALDRLEHRIEEKQARLDLLSRVLIRRHVASAVTPAGWPVRGGWISSPFGPRIDPFTGRPSFHPGIDIADPTGTPIHAMAAGIVTYAGKDGGYGMLVRVADGNGRTTYYGHTSKILVSLGQLVQKGQLIARVGSTGRSTGPHLHFEVRQNGDPVNPAPYLHRTHP
ncbi:MAG: M23 family metallopeptidase [Acidiferrobacteraceae bacterium]